MSSFFCVAKIDLGSAFRVREALESRVLVDSLPRTFALRVLFEIAFLSAMRNVILLCEIYQMSLAASSERKFARSLALRSRIDKKQAFSKTTRIGNVEC